MRRHILLLLIVLPALFFLGCENAGSGDTVVSAARTTPGKDSLAETTAGTSADAEPAMEATVGAASTVGTSSGSTASGEGSSGEPEALSAPEAPFVADPETSGGSSFQADSLLAVRYGAHEGYERVVLDLGTGAEPAGMVPEWRLTSPAGDGLLRVELPSVSATGVSDGRFDGALLRDFYVVRAPEGGMFVDVFADEGFTYRVVGLSEPARLVVDFKPSGTPLGMPLPEEGGNTVLTRPRSGDRVESPLTVSGYSRNFEGNNVVVLTDSEGRVLGRWSVGSNDWATTWGYFEATLDLPAFSGKGTLRVGAESARDGSFEGVEIPVRGARR
jgi:hypothetical protein